MPYILGTLLVWFVVAAALGGVIGWMAHSVFRGITSPRSAPAVGISTTDAAMIVAVSARDPGEPDDMEELWSRSTVLEPAARQRDRLHRELDARRAGGTAGAAQPVHEGVSKEEYEALQAERTSLRNLVHRYEATLGVQQATVDRLQRQLDSGPENAPPVPDLASGAAVLGRSVTLNDLTVVVGIDAELEALCHQHGILTWWQLATTPISELRTMLETSDLIAPMPDPSSWPTLARLLAHGNWEQFKNVSERMYRT